MYLQDCAIVATHSRQPIGINGKISRGQKARGTNRIDG